MVNLKKQSGNFHVVAGAFRVKANSEKKLQQLKSLGFSARLIGVNKYGLHQVAYESFQERLDALKNLRKIKNTQNPDAWLLVKEIEK